MIIGVHCYSFFFFNDTATTEIYTLSLHDALPIYLCIAAGRPRQDFFPRFVELSVVNCRTPGRPAPGTGRRASARRARSEEHTSELQSRQYLVCRLLLEKKKKN